LFSRRFKTIIKVLPGSKIFHFMSDDIKGHSNPPCDLFISMKR
jgi:hypothetical protein